MTLKYCWQCETDQPHKGNACGHCGTVYRIDKAKQKERRDRLLPDGIPRYVRCYDGFDIKGGINSLSMDRFTVVFTGPYRKDNRRDQFVYIGMSQNPFHPLGIGQHGSSGMIIDRPSYSHLGKKIPFQSLPVDCQRCALNTYRSIWGLE